MKVSHIAKMISKKYGAHFTKEDWYGKEVFVQKNPVYIAIAPIKDEGKIHLIISREEFDWPEFVNEDMTPEEAIKTAGKYMLFPENRQPEQISFF